METEAISKPPKNGVLEDWLECPSCHYQWPPIVIVPVACPACKRRFRPDMLPIKILHPPQSRKSKKLPRAEVLDRTARRSTLCERCVELDPVSNTYAVLNVHGKNLCKEHATEEAR